MSTLLPDALFDAADRYAPARPGWRLITAVVFAVPGAFLGLFGLYGFLVTVFGSGYTLFVAGIPLAVFGALAVAIGWYLANDVLAAASDGRTGEATVELEQDDAMAALRRRYAEGEIDEPTFERKVETLLATEDATSTSAVTEGLADEEFSERLTDPEMESDLSG